MYIGIPYLVSVSSQNCCPLAFVCELICCLCCCFRIFLLEQILTSSRLEKSRSQRVLWLLEECKIDYELKTFKRINMLAPSELKEIHPLGKSPIVIVESEANPKPLVLAESGPLMEYLIDHFSPHLAPERYQKGKDGEVGGETEGWVRYRYYMHYAEGSLTPFLIFSLLFNGKYNPERMLSTSLTGFCSNENAVSVLSQAPRYADDWSNRIEISQPKLQDELGIS